MIGSLHMWLHSSSQERPSKTRWVEADGNREVYPMRAHGHQSCPR